MGISFTEKQQQVIDARDCNLLVSAAAGSGKTAVLVERIVGMVSDKDHPVDIDRLLVVTFTNAAAAEMRERISRALNDRLAAEPENEHLQKQVTLLHNARITTIDSFCLFVLRNQFHTIGLDPGFRIAEEGEGKLIRQEALEETLEAGYAAEEEEFLHCVEYFSSGSRDTAVEEMVLKLYDFAMSTPFPEQWLKERKQDYRASQMMPAETLTEAGEHAGEDRESVRFEEIPWVRELLRQTRLLLEGCVEKLAEAIRMCEEPDGPYMYGELLEQEKEMTERILQKCGAAEADEAGGVFEILYTAFETVRFGRLPSKKDETVSAGKREAVKGIRTAVKEQLGDLQKKYFFKSKEQVVEQMTVCQRAVSALVDLTLAFKEVFEAKKRDKNILDFDDIEHFALSILVKQDEKGECSPTETALEYRSHFHEILIDEYQDSNLVQEYILSCISGEEEGRYNRFMVGDVKQSIYKFRLARPELFLEKYMAYGQEEQAGRRTARKIDLHRNFRSRREVLNTVNTIFEQIMGQDVGGILYDDLAALHPGADYPVQEKEEARAANVTELLLVDASEQADDFQGFGSSSFEGPGDEGERLTAKEQEAYCVAAKIQELMRELQVTDKESGTLRRLAYRDIVILLRTMSGWDESFKRVLEKEGIPVYMTSRTGYFAASEVQELLHFLRILDNPLQDIPLYGVLHSYLGGFAEEEIALIRASYPKKKYLFDALQAWTESVEEAGEEPVGEASLGMDGGITAKIRSFLSCVSRYRRLAVCLSVQELLQTILRETAYLHYVAVKPEGNKRRANVEMLLVKAADYEKTSYFGLYHFLRYMEQLEKYEVDYGEAGLQDENADVVRIMSIHKSKGLEFPVCFVSGLAKKFQTRDLSAHLVLDLDAGIGVDYVDPDRRVRSRDLRRNVIAEKMRADNLAEEMRILYVAMTRAKEKLILTGTVRSPEKLAVSLIPLMHKESRLLPYDVLMDQGSFLQLLMAALARNRCMDDFYRAYDLEPAQKAPFYEQDMSMQVKLYDWEAIVEEKLNETVRMEGRKRELLLSDPSEDVNPLLMKRLADSFVSGYPYETLRSLYTKTTVSELKMVGMREEMDFSFNLYAEETVAPYLPGFLEKDGKVTGSMRGSAFHKVMELFDFTRLTDAVIASQAAVDALLQEQIEEMRQKGRLSEEYYAVVSLPKVAAFLRSDAAKRMGEAARAGRLHKEQPFVLGLPANRLRSEFPQEETVLIQGIIDVFFEENGRYVLLDYKTDAVESAEELVKRYRVQLDYYAEALEQFSRYRDTEKILYSFKLGEEIHL
ncbi:MAG: helicase-exonuclease AddAB subunit AddA [Lachnospiraceae bacterium]|nr:helicase-exonuclease AddAB subunit AddA [Lachnospiraceae bacterium]